MIRHICLTYVIHLCKSQDLTNNRFEAHGDDFFGTKSIKMYKVTKSQNFCIILTYIF